MEKAVVSTVYFMKILKKCFGHVLTNILNTVLINQIILTSWKHSVIQRIPISDLQQDSMKILCKRIIPYISNVIPF